MTLRAPTGEEIRRGRKALGLRQEDLARRLGVCRNSIGLWERGERTPKNQPTRAAIWNVIAGPAGLHADDIRDGSANVR